MAQGTPSHRGGVPCPKVRPRHYGANVAAERGSRVPLLSAMAALSPEQFAQLANVLVGPIVDQLKNMNAAQGHANGDGGGGWESGDRSQSGTRIEEKHFKRLDKFSHGTVEYQEWALEFKTLLGTRNRSMVDALVVAEKDDETYVDSAERFARGDGRQALDDINYEARNAELYDVLFVLTAGEARLVVKGVDRQDGVVAWQRLAKHFNRRTLTTALRLHKEAMHPDMDKDVTKLAAVIMKWEETWRRMERESGVSGAGIPALWKIGALLEICPRDIR